MADAEPGIARIEERSRVVYRDQHGRLVRDRTTLDRIRALAIPPAWTDVWICARENGHLQATGRDARGRKQYRYHANWRSERDHDKYQRMIDFASALPSIRRRVEGDLRKPPLSRPFVLAAIVRLLEKTLIRIGNKEYARANHSFGLTTLLDSHVRIEGRSVRFRFRAKSGIEQDVELNDPSLAKIVKQCRDLPGKTLFQYIDAEGARQRVGSADVNRYLRGITGRPFTAKDFRTWAGTVLAAAALCECERPTSEAAFKRTIVRAVDSVAARLGNTRAVCRTCYIHPAVFEAFRRGVTIRPTGSGPRPSVLPGADGRRPRLSTEEAAVLALLNRRGGYGRGDSQRAA